MVVLIKEGETNDTVEDDQESINEPTIKEYVCSMIWKEMFEIFPTVCNNSLQQQSAQK